MGAGGLRFIKGGGGGDSAFDGNRVISRNIPGLVGVNLGTKKINTTLEKMLFIAQPPSISIAGSFRLNGSASFVPFSTIERGTLVEEVKIIATGAISANSPNINLIEIFGGALPASFVIDPASGNPVRQAIDAGPFVLNSPKSYSARAKDTTDVYSAQPGTAWTIGVPAYHGKGNVTGAGITEAFIRGLSKTGLNQGLGSVTATPAADEYIFYVAPVSWGIKVFEFLSADQTNPESALRVKVRTDAEILNGIAQADATEYYVIRSLTAGLGSGSPYTFQIGNPG